MLAFLTDKGEPMKPVLMGAALAFLATSALAADPPIVREPIATFKVDPAKAVSEVQTFRGTVAPGQAVPPHYHPAPVVCFVEKGTFAYKIGDAAEATVTVGGAAFEPANTPIHYFRNTSATDPAVLVCAFLAGAGDKTLTVPLEK